MCEYLRIQNCGEDRGGRSLLNWPRAVLKFESFSHSMALGQLPAGSAEQPTQGSVTKARSLCPHRDERQAFEGAEGGGPKICPASARLWVAQSR